MFNPWKAKTEKKENSSNGIYLSIPTYDGRVGQGIVNALFGGGHVVDRIHIQWGSLLTKNFNVAYATALNNRKNAITHFCILHEDITPEPLWLKKMMAIMESKRADILSVVVPLKSELGVTSTALDEKCSWEDAHWRPRRLTLTEVFKNYEPTFTDAHLLVNTGLMLVDLRPAWAEKLYFEFEDKFIPHPYKPELVIPVNVSEDWNFSRKARKEGARIWATREIKVTHTGQHTFKNDHIWGTLERDREVTDPAKIEVV